jgi:hypothetical protein
VVWLVKPEPDDPWNLETGAVIWTPTVIPDTTTATPGLKCTAMAIRVQRLWSDDPIALT